jgi:aspartyl/asparaginyl-tRNA synthetase
MKDIVFIDISDGSCLEGLQVLISKSEQPKTLTYGAAVEAAGDEQKWTVGGGSRRFNCC